MSTPTPTPPRLLNGCGKIIAALLEAGAGGDPTNPLFPMFFDEVDCGGKRFPNAYQEIKVPTGFGDGQKIRSMIKPAEWRVLLDNDEVGFEQSGVTYTDCDYIKVGKSLPVDGTSAASQTVSLCMGRPPYAFGQKYRTPYYPTSDSCDLFMENSYCKQGDNIDTDECSCFREQRELQAQYPDLVLPVACFGQKCAKLGYQTYSIASNNCTIPVCAEMVQESSGSLKVTGKTEIKCGPREFTIPNFPTITPSPTSPNLAPLVDKEKTPAYVIAAGVLSIVSGFLLILLMLMFA